LWTVIGTREYSPDELAAFDSIDSAHSDDTVLRLLAARSLMGSAVWVAPVPR